MKEYKLIKNDNSKTNFEWAITESLNNGWELHGSTFIAGNYRDIYCQAMIKDSKNEKVK